MFVLCSVLEKVVLILLSLPIERSKEEFLKILRIALGQRLALFFYFDSKPYNFFRGLLQIFICKLKRPLHILELGLKCRLLFFEFLNSIGFLK